MRGFWPGQGIEPLLDNLFSFLRRKTDFYTGADQLTIEEVVLKVVRKHSALAEKEQAERKKAREKELAKKKQLEEEKKRKVRCSQPTTTQRIFLRLNQRISLPYFILGIT